MRIRLMLLFMSIMSFTMVLVFLWWTSPQGRCQWEFVNYTPSPYERYWTENIATLQSDICAESNKHIDQINQWIQYAGGSSALQTDVFSYFQFQNSCSGEIITDFVEPLAGLTRSPLFCLKGEEFIVSKDYLVVSWNLSKKHFPRSYYFDLGASLYNSGAGGPSQKWFVETYEKRGIQWDGIFAWEMEPLDPKTVWGLIPSHLKKIYHWYNIPVSPDHADNALNFIRDIARPQDFVLLKIDIDNSPIEEALVDQILASSELQGLIDEFYFEHHVNTKPMHGAWGTADSPRMLADTYRIFSTLRRNGIVAHSWV